MRLKTYQEELAWALSHPDTADGFYPLVARIGTPLEGGFFAFAKLAPSDNNKGVARGHFTPKDSQLANHPCERAVGASASDGQRGGWLCAAGPYGS